MKKRTEPSGVVCSDLFSALIRLAAQMARKEGMPPVFIEDWQLPKTTPVKTQRMINEKSCKAHDQCGMWACELRIIADRAKSLKGNVSDTKRLDWLIKQGPPNACDDGFGLSECLWEAATDHVDPDGKKNNKDRECIRDAVDAAMFPNEKGRP